MRNKITHIAALVVSIAMVGCKRDERQFIQDTVTQVSAKVLHVDASAAMTPKEQHRYSPFDPNEVPRSFLQFNPVEISFGDSGGHLIVTARHVQHRTGLYIAHPGERVPESTRHLTYEEIAPDLYFYQD